MLIRIVEATLVNKTRQSPDEQRPTPGQRVPLGDTGDGKAPDEQGISNPPGDRARELDAEQDDGEDLEDDEDDDVEDVDDVDDVLEDADQDDVTDPGSEPGKPV